MKMRMEFESLNDEQKANAIYNQSLKHEHIIITCENNNYFLRDGGDIEKVDKTILVDAKSKAPYNNLYNQILEERKKQSQIKK